MYTNILPALLSAAALLPTLATAAPTCHDYIIISTRGTYEHQGDSIAFPNMTAATLKAVQGGLLYNTVYPANTSQMSPIIGANNIVSTIKTGLKNCPKQKYALLGYSQGADATNIALHNFTTPGTPGYEAIRAVLVVGNPAHKPMQSSNYDETGNKTTNSFLGSAYFSTPRIPEVWYENTRLLDICYLDDIVCNGAQPGGRATLIPHLKYGSTKSVQDMGGNFLIGSLFPDPGRAEL